MEDLIIRPANERDREDYLELRIQDSKEYSQIIGEKIYIDKEQLEKEFKGMLQSDNSFILVAEMEGKLVGYLNGSLIKNIWQNAGYIDDIFIINKFKRKGIATKLINCFIENLKNGNIKKCKLSVNLKNKSARELYKNCGFKIYGYEMFLDLDFAPT